MVEADPHGGPGQQPLRTLDPLFTTVGFAFDIDRSNPVAGGGPGPPAGAADKTGAVGYLARDFAGLREVLLDRLAAISPAGVDRHLPDVGTMLVELFAYAGDDLSYYQDAVATEAYLRTARRRISVRRHARLLGYHVHEGCAARAWVCLEVDRPVTLPLSAVLFTTAAGAPLAGPGFTPLVPGVATTGPAVATTGPAVATTGIDAGSGPRPSSVDLHPGHNEIAVWHWGRHTCALPTGATAATFLDTHSPATSTGAAEPPARALALRGGDVVLFEETNDATGGPPDPTHRHAVRLRSVRRGVDPLYGVPIVEVTWAARDALPFTLPVRAEVRPGELVACSVVRGNVVGVLHGTPMRRSLDDGQRALPDPGLAWSQPFPDPAAVAGHQACVLRRLFVDWRATVERWWRDAQHGQALSAERLATLRAQVGARAVDELGLSAGGDAGVASRHAAGLRRLLVDSERLLAGRRRRLAVLARLAEARGPLGPTLVAELRDDWGPALTAALDAAEPAAWGPAAETVDQDPRRALPALDLTMPAPPGDAPPLAWTVVADLLDRDTDGSDVLVEMDDDRRAQLRFRRGDPPDGELVARYLLGGGIAGNVPAEAITAVTLAPEDPIQAGAATPNAPGQAGPATGHDEQAAAGDALRAVRSVRNPLPATGGCEPEDPVAVKRTVPRRYLVDQPRALDAGDYAYWAGKVEGVRRAASVMRWTGSSPAAEVAVQPTAGGMPDRFLLDRVRRRLHPVRRVGHDLWVRAPGYRPVILTLRVDLERDVVRADVRAALLALLSGGYRPDGSEALFHPSRLRFGQAVATSSVVAAVRDVDGVESVVVTRFAFLDEPVDLTAAPAAQPPESLAVGPLQILRLDNDPAVPSNGYAEVELRGGR